MDIAFITTLFIIGFIGAFISGMIGIGGAVINYPMLLYIPSLVGVMSLTAHEVSGIGAIQVFFATLGGVWAYRKSGLLNKALIIYMGSSILLGSVLGSYFSHYISEKGINFIYGILAIIAVILIFIPKKGQKGQEHSEEDKEVIFNKWLASSLAFIIGGVSGILGAGGAFILVHIMLSILNIPVRITVASSLAITFLSSIGATVGKVITDQVLFVPALVLIMASLIASPIGASVGQKVNTKFLQWVLAQLIGATAIKIWLELL